MPPRWLQSVNRHHGDKRDDTRKSILHSRVRRTTLLEGQPLLWVLGGRRLGNREAYGYILGKVQYNNAFFVDSSVCLPEMTDLPAGVAWKAGYRDAPNRRRLFSYNSDVEHWLELEPDAAVTSIRDFYSGYEGMYSIRVT